MSAGPVPGAGPRGGWHWPAPATLGAFAIFFAEAFVFASWLPRLPELKSALDLSEGELGLLLLALPAGALVVMPLAGWMSTRMSVGRLNLICLTWMMLAVAAIGLVPASIEPAGRGIAAGLLGIVLCAVGLGSGSMGVAMNAAGAAVEQAIGRPILSRCHGMFSTGLATGGLVAGGAASAGLPVLAHLGLVGAVLFVVLVGAVRVLPVGDAPGRDSAAPLRVAWPRGALLVPGGIAFGCLLAEGAALDWSPVYLATVLEADPALVGSGVAAFAGAMAVVRFAGDALSGRLGEMALVAIGAALAAAGYAAVALAPTAPAALGGFVLVGLGLAPIVPIALRIGARLDPAAPGVGIAAVSTLGYAGFLLGPALIGLTAEVLDLRAAFGAVAALLIIVLGLSSRLRRPD